MQFIPPVSPQRVVEVLSSADISVILLQPDGENNAMPSPNKFYQSIVAGVPILASDYGRFPELIKQTQYGLLGDVVNPSNTNQVCCKIKKLSGHRLNSKIRNNLSLASKHLSWESEAKKLLSIYEKCLGKINSS